MVQWDVADSAKSGEAQNGGRTAENDAKTVASAEANETVNRREKTTVKKKKCRSLWITLASIFGAVLLVFGAISIYNNSGIYEFTGSNSYWEVRYRGNLSHLVANKESMLRVFLVGGRVDGKQVSVIICNDYTIYNHLNNIGGIDIADDDITIYYKGLIKATTDSGYYERFHDDLVVAVHKRRNGDRRTTEHSYYFYFRSDALEWLKNPVYN